MYEFVNVNPCKRRLGDCVIRALSLALNQQWERTYIDLCIEGYIQCDMPNANNVWEAYLIYKGFKRYPVPEVMTFEEFAETHNDGQLYVVATGSHVAVIKNETLYDNWDSSEEIIAYYFVKEQDNAL